MSSCNLFQELQGDLRETMEAQKAFEAYYTARMSEIGEELRTVTNEK